MRALNKFRCFMRSVTNSKNKCLNFPQKKNNKHICLATPNHNNNNKMDTKLVRPVFTLELNYKIVPGLVTIGKYDGTHPCLTAATTADKILIHSPHRRNNVAYNNVPGGRIISSESNREIATLNINQKITALAAGILLPNDDKDVLIVGTETHILAYHVHDNKDVFYQECPDGVRALALGQFKDFKNNLVMVGGNSSVHGYDAEGNEVFWTAVGDVVTSLIVMDFNKDGANELIVSSEDFSIKIFKGDQVLSEHIETEVVTNLTSLPDNKFAYSVSNGTLGIYEQDVRLWRVKSKHFAISMQHYDLLGHGQPQLITGWSNGKIDCRSIQTGEVLFKDSMNSGVAGIIDGDYRSIGKSDVICTSSEGEMRGYTTTKVLHNAPGVGLEQDTVRELMARKQALLLELKHYDNNTKYNESAVDQMESFESDGVIPANTRLQIGIAPSENKIKQSQVEIFVSTNNTTVIKAVIIFAEGIFKGETHVIHPITSKLRSELLIPLFLPRDYPVDIHIKALVGYPNSQQFHVFEITRQLPRFSMYALIEDTEKVNEQKTEENFVEFRINERLQRICMWINQNFLLTNDIEVESEPCLKVYFKCLRDDTVLKMVFEISGKTFFYTENMSLAADLVQSLTDYLRIENLESKVSFGREETDLKNCMAKFNDIQDTRLRLGTDVADRLGQIRTLVIRAEDSRLNDIAEMPKYYNELNILNKELIGSYNIRLQNYNEGLETMKKINSTIQKASRLRVGQHAATMINHCRLAIKNNNVEGLIKIIRTGEL